MARLRVSIGVASAVLCLLAVGASGCSGCFTHAGQTSLGIMPGVVNDPGNRSLRRAVLRFGLETFCKEMTHRGAPLKLKDEEPVTGRFYARTCNYQEMENGDAFVQFAGQGFVWTNVTLRVGFEAGGAIQYNQDFLMDGSTMYAYFRTRTIASTTFKTILVERGGDAGASIFGSSANPIAKQIVDQQLSRGLTVIRDSDGVVDFSLGLVEKGQRPPKPFDVKGSGRMMLSNEKTEVHGQELDFLGPYEIDSDGRALYLTAVVDGVPAIDAFVIRKDGGDPWVDAYVRKPGIPLAPQPPLMQDVIPTRVQWQKTVPLAKGFYYVVLDNSSAMGNVAPPVVASNPLIPSALAAPQPAALVNFAVQLGDAP
jgi:hypothetical protein